MRVGAGGGKLDVHISELSLDELVMGDGYAELLALVHVREGYVEAGLHDAGRISRVWVEVGITENHTQVDQQTARDVLGQALP